ncbi:MarR family winged helix-turn-helix transcriptional regulator [Algoriphagus yeomjeoni]|uniref:MarR family winged helix-turn-helix transcriptional regulator n=1 Tax=Algoriphagus yeomjeoni TaxID=291403 RepID=UPI003CE46E87
MGSLEEAIKQKEFKDPYNKLVVNLLYTHSYLVSAQNKILKPFDLSPEQFNVLRILRGQNGVPTTVSSIQDRMLNKMSNASRLVDKLKIKQLVERRECPADRRQVDIVITDKGLKLLSDCQTYMEGFNYEVVKLSEDEAILMSNLLDKLRG